MAEVVDDEDPLVNPVYFHYSNDNSTWITIGTGVFSHGRFYKVEWETSELEDHDHYHIRANYSDSTGLTAESYMKDIATRNRDQESPEADVESEKWYQKPRNLLIGAGAAVLIGIVIALFLVALKTAGNRIRKERESKERKRQEEDRKRTFDKERRIRDREMDYLIRTKSMRDISGKSHPITKPDGGVPLRPGEKGIGRDQIQTEKRTPELEDMEVKAELGPMPAPIGRSRESEGGTEMFRPPRTASPVAFTSREEPKPAEVDGYDIDCRCGEKVWIPAGEGYFNFKCGSCGRAGRVLR
jgi:hypothetical protein